MSSIKKQGVTNALITYAGVLIGFVSLLFIQPNLLKPDELGLTRILIAAASLIATILPLGVSSVTTKFFPYFRNEEKGHHGYFGFMLLFPIVGTIICAGLIYLFRDKIIAQYIEQSFLFTHFFDLLLPFAMVISINMVLNAYCSSLFKTAIISLFESIVTRILFILIIIIYYFQMIDLEEFVHLFVLIYVLQAISMFLYIYTIDRPSLRIDRLHLRSVGAQKLIVFGLLLALTNVSSISMKHLDAIMIGKYMSLEQVGIFAVAAYIALMIEIPLVSLERITHTKVSQGWANGDVEGIRKIYYESVKYLMLIGGLLLVGIVMNISDLLSLLPGIYHTGAIVTIIACVGSFLNIATGVNTSILFSSEKYLYGTLFLVILLVLTFVLNILFIPRYGIEGAALATAIAAVIYNALKYLIIWKSFGMQPYDRSSLKILLVIGITFAVVYFMPVLAANAIISMMIKSVVILAVYLGLSYMLKIAPELHKHIPFLK